MNELLTVGTVVDFQHGSFLNTGEIVKVNSNSYRVQVRNVFGATSIYTVRFNKIYRVLEA